jgi:2-oxoglutarate ferredoxin oxidoreductase subunit beta
MIAYYKKHTTPIGSKAKNENPNLIERGIFVQQEQPEYCNQYEQLVQKAMKGR